jgi:bacteriocin biosynthesis cyclodehydratase domain-containing protein
MRQEDRFKIPDRFTLIPAGPDEYRLHSLTFSLALRGRSSELLSRLLELVDGKRTVADLVRELETVGEESVHEALRYLLEAGALERAVTGDSGPMPSTEMRRYQPQIAFLSHFVAPAEVPGGEFGPGMPRSGLEYQERIQQAHVVVFGVGRLGSQLIRALVLAGVGKITAVDSEPVSDAELKSDSWFTVDQEGHNRAEAACRLAAIANPEVHIQAAPEPAEIGELQERLVDSDFAILCRDHFNPAEYEMFNLAALATKKSWTSARIAGFEFQIGPTVIPFQTACYRCFDLRQKSNLPDLAEYEILENFLKKDRLRPEALAFTPGTGLVALEVLKAITWFMAPATCSHLFTLDLLTMESKLHPVLKIPRCPACGRPAQARPTIHAWQQSHIEIKP